jgi:peroxiredoxin Q/BCP
VESFRELGAVVLGISPDATETQKKFERDHGLGVPLLSDTGKEVLTEYGAFGEKKRYGRLVKGVIRSTFLIDPQGKTRKIWSNVRVDGHAEEVRESLRELTGGK